jgi:hypothetical protein
MRMSQIILAGAIAASSFAVFPSGGMADTRAAARNEACTATFSTNQTEIEALAGAGNTAGIKRLFASHRCPDIGVRITKPAGTGPKNRIHVQCKLTIDPIGIDCIITFGR